MQYSDTRYKVVSFTRDVSLASGTQIITGVGFEGKAIEIFMFRDGDGIQASWGKSDGITTVSGGIRIVAGTYTHGGANISRFFFTGADYLSTAFTSFDADGFTLTHTKEGAPTGTATYIALIYR